MKAFQIAWHIISTSPEKEEILPMKEMVVCEQCQKHFLDEGMNWNRISSYVRLAVFCIEKKFHKYIMSDNQLVKTIMDAATLTGLVAGIGWVAKKVIKENFTSDPSNNVMNYVKFTAVMAGSIALKNYLQDQKILPDSL